MASFRDYAAQDREEPDDALANLREMHRNGDITDEEFRTIQATTHSHLLGATTADGFSDTDETSTNESACWIGSKPKHHGHDPT